MARNIAYWQQVITDAKNANTTLAALNSTSAVAIWRLIIYIVAVCAWTLDNLFDLHKKEVTDLIAAQKIYRVKWYVEAAKSFQYGFDLLPDSDEFDNAGADDATIEASKVISFAAAEEVMNGVRIKVAKLVSGELAPVPTGEFNAFKAYMERVKPMGIRLDEFYVNTTSDSLKLTIRIAYNPLLLDSTGKRLDGTNDTPVQDAITDYLINGIEFNGLFKPMKLEDNVQAVDGVDNVHIELVQARYGANPYADVGLKYQPYSGYLRFINPSDLTLIFEPA